MVRSLAMAVASAVLAAALTVAPTGAAALTPTPRQRLHSVRSWAFAIGDGALARVLRRNAARFGLVIVDGEEVTPAQVALLHKRGQLVIGYLSVGTIEAGRWWYPRVKPYRLDLWDEWDEWYANVNAPGYRAVIATRVVPWMLRKGLDGLFLDSTDSIESHPLQTAGMRHLVATIAATVHARGCCLLTQNGDTTVLPMLSRFDGWNREDVTWTWDFEYERYVRVAPADHARALAALKLVRSRGLVTFATDYTPSAGSLPERWSVAAARSAAALPYVSDVGLARVPAQVFPRP